MIEKLALEAGQRLKQRGLRLVTVESCTGGGLSYWITSIPNSSLWFERGYVTYTREAKMETIGVQSATLDLHGEVSEATVKEMAAGGLKQSHADICIAITGIAGPGGGSAQKPVGTVWIAWAKRNAFTYAKTYFFTGDRQHIRLCTMEAALSTLLDLTSE